jgi:hypothetical protein
MSVIKRLVAFSVLPAWCAVLLAYRIARTDSSFTNPSRVFDDVLARVIDPLAHMGTLGVTVIYGIGLTLGYAAVRSIPPPRQALMEDTVPAGESRPSQG